MDNRQTACPRLSKDERNSLRQRKQLGGAGPGSDSDDDDETASKQSSQISSALTAGSSRTDQPLPKGV